MFRIKASLLTIVLILWCAPVAHAAIAFDTAATGADNGGLTNSLTFSSGNTAGSLRFGFVGCLGDNITGGNDDFSTPTWDGTTMTLVDKYITPDGTLDRFQYLWYLTAPPTGTKNIVVGAGSTHFILCGEVAYTGVKQSGNPVESIVNLGSTTSATTALTTTVDNSWVVGFSQCGGCSASTGFNSRASAPTYNDWMLGDSNGVVHPAGSYTMVTGGTGAGVAHILASIQPDTGGAVACTGARMLMGIGGC